MATYAILGVARYFVILFFTSVIVCRATLYLISSVFALRSLKRFVVSTGFHLLKPRRYLAVSIFFTLLSISSHVNFLSSIAFLVAAMASGTLSGKQSMSLPAINASAAASPPGQYFATPFISKASVNVKPLYPSLVFKRPVTLFFESEVAMLTVLSMAGIYK